MTKEEIKDLKSQVNIVDIISQTISLYPKGNSLVGLCPFHEDTNPSLNVSVRKQRFNCFACDQKGDVIDFVQKSQNCTFSQALNMLQNDYEPTEMNISKTEPEQVEEIKIQEDKEKQLEILNKFSMDCEINLKMSQEANEYLAKRGLTKEDIEMFDVGFIGSKWTMLQEFQKDYSDVDLKACSILNETGRVALSNRIVFPLQIQINDYKQTIGYSARTIYDNDKTPKYLNSGTSKLYKKHEFFYNEPNVINNLKTQNLKKEVYLVEGVFDVIAMNKNGYKNTLALLGTALSQRHIDKLKEWKVKQVNLNLDPDTAGVNATAKSIKLLMENGLKSEVIINGSNLDIADLANQKDEKEFKGVINNRISGEEFLYVHITNKYELSNLNNHQDYINELESTFEKSEEYVKTHIFNLVQKEHNINRVDFYNYNDFADFYELNKNKTKYELAKELWILQRKMVDIKKHSLTNTEEVLKKAVS